MSSFSKFKKNVLGHQGLLDKFTCQESTVVISSDLNVFIDDELVCEAPSLEEARAYARSYIIHKKIVETVDSIIPEEKVVTLIKKYHNIDKITSTVVESYIDLASSNTFSLDPVINELKDNSIAGKLTYKLDDDSVVAINEDTYKMLSELVSDKYQIVEYMRKSKDNFMHVVKELKEE